MLNYDLSPEIWGSYLQVCKILDVHPFWLLESILQCQGPHLQSRPPSPLAKPALGVALAMGVLTAGQAQAFVVTVGGQDWDVTTFTGSYIVNTSKFGLPPAPAVMPWWGSASLAQQFVAATGGNLGSPPPKLRDSLHPSSDLNKTLTILMLPGPTLVFRAAPFLSMLTL